MDVSPVGLEAHFHMQKPTMNAADIPAYDDRLEREADEQAGKLQAFGFEDDEHREKLRIEFVALVTEYQEGGQVTDQMVIWLPTVREASAGGLPKNASPAVRLE